MTVPRSEEHTSELQSHHDLVCRLLLEKKKNHGQDHAGSGRSRPARRRAHLHRRPDLSLFFFLNDTATTEIYTRSLHDALPIWIHSRGAGRPPCEYEIFLHGEIMPEKH